MRDRLRSQPPVATPLEARTLAAALGAAVTGGRAPRRRSGDALRAMFQARAVLLTDSGTTALALALKAAQSARSGPVALPAYGCFDLATAAIGAGARVVCYDVEPETLQPEARSLGHALDAGPSAVVVAHLCGIPVDIEATTSSGTQALIIDDAAQAVGTSLRGRLAGAGGSFGVLSFGRGKGLAGGGGGALLAHTEDAARLLEELAGGLAQPSLGWVAFGKLVAQWVFGRPALYALAAAAPFLHLGETRYRAPGRLRGMGASAAGALAASLPHVERDNWTRRRHAGILDAAVRTSPDVRRIRPTVGAEPGYLRYPVLSATLAAQVAASAALRALGLQRGYPCPLPELAALRPAVLNADAAFPGAATLAAGLVTLPTHCLLRARDLDALRALFGRAHGRLAEGPSAMPRSRAVPAS